MVYLFGLDRLLWIWRTLSGDTWPTQLCTLPVSKITPEGFALFFFKTGACRSGPFWLFITCIQTSIFLQREIDCSSCKSPCGAQVETTDPERLRETGNSGKGESRSNLDFLQCQRWTSTLPNLDCVFHVWWKNNSRSKPCLAKKVPQKRTESNASCMIERPGCPEPRAQAVIIQSVYTSTCKSKILNVKIWGWMTLTLRVQWQERVR